MDITKPLKRWQLIRTKGDNTVKINIKYERLPHFCFLCGIISHTEKDCSNVSDENWGMAGEWILGLRREGDIIK